MFVDRNPIDQRIRENDRTYVVAWIFEVRIVLGARSSQVWAEVPQVNQGSLYPVLHRVEQKGWVSAECGMSENNRQAKFYALTRAGRRQLERETKNWVRLSAAVARIMESA